jgi:uncharacterized membrane protein
MANAINVDEDAKKKSSTGMEPKIAVLLSYLFSWLGGLIFFLMEKENKFVKWNALQALILGIIEMIALILFVFILGIPLLFVYVGIFFMAIGWIIFAAGYICAIIAIVMSFQGKTFRIPGVCKLTDKYFKM